MQLPALSFCQLIYSYERTALSRFQHLRAAFQLPLGAADAVIAVARSPCIHALAHRPHRAAAREHLRLAPAQSCVDRAV